MLYLFHLYLFRLAIHSTSFIIPFYISASSLPPSSLQLFPHEYIASDVFITPSPSIHILSQSDISMGLFSFILCFIVFELTLPTLPPSFTCLYQRHLLYIHHITTPTTILLHSPPHTSLPLYPLLLLLSPSTPLPSSTTP